MSTTRQQIIEHIQQKQVATAAEISRSLRITTADARHHLAILLDQGGILIVGYRPAAGRGRPAALYALTQTVIQNNLPVLSSALLAELITGQPPAQQAEYLRHIAENMAGTEMVAPQNPTRRIYLAIERLNHMHYQARWEAHIDAPRLTLRHCPYASILDQYPVLCELDRYLISLLTGAQAELTDRLVTTSQGTHECHFILRR